eukprot:2265115-Pleurochrysis_carterae.AAC.1
MAARGRPAAPAQAAAHRRVCRVESRTQPSGGRGSAVLARRSAPRPVTPPSDYRLGRPCWAAG